MTSHSLNIPVIETERLRLRGHGVDDLAVALSMWSDPDVTRFISGKPLSEDEVWSKLLRYVGHWALTGHGFWLIEEKVSRRFLGEAGFFDARRTMTPSFGERPEIGWGLGPWAWGKGYAREAVQAVIAWGDRTLTARETVCLIHPENVRSLRLAEACGYREFARTVVRDEPAILLRRVASI
jgi:RimJ/RimL family protein N-acetyltransferase